MGAEVNVGTGKGLGGGAYSEALADGEMDERRGRSMRVGSGGMMSGPRTVWMMVAP